METNYVILRQIGNQGESVLGNRPTIEDALALVTKDQLDHIEESEKPDCPIFAYRICLVCVEGKATPKPDGRHEVEQTLRFVKRRG